MTRYALALGMFDGVHIGHKAVLDGAVKSEYKSVAVTFKELPFKNGGSIMTAEAKEKKLLAYGLDEVKFFDFSEIKDLLPFEFLDYICQKHNVAKICCGFNYRFGKCAMGDTDVLREYCDKNGIEFFECPEVIEDGRTVSSTLIKKLLLEGEVEHVAELLGEEFSFTSEVMSGDKRGRRLGFPTTNQKYPEDIAGVKHGVYQTVIEIDGKRYDSVTNIGFRPTFKTDFISAETFILNFSGDAYGKKAKVSLIKYLREEKKFSSAEELISAINQNAEYVKQNSRV